MNIVSTLQGAPGRGYRIDAESAAGGHLQVSHALTARGDDASEDGTGRGTPLTAAKCLTTSQERQDYDTQDFVTDGGVRRLTPTECERLQGFPDGWSIPDETDWREYPRPDGPRYAQMGNAVTVPCAQWIGERLMKYGRD